ncbi:hypothetical protein [Flammeovirga kamogawensis]|uniref:Uncharacterized protein n=1 Tax=Flammeovirga kamogawensis TaxID=373891 RepID=A0ABX8H128_9BACT|nr:hypothetical protein [Flammeovirga kamogawensis]MBB6463251.1 hypothetical protein [Flammeovirga kamogawensis]QWG09598.1 hypothetical protein KM029_23610 [Flammeovirga kamogawensis]TRX65113.1 hypothetical protein EO216_21510 [Flammeovirga kamogawensis]
MYYKGLLLVVIAFLFSQITYAQVFKFESPSKEQNISLSSLPNGNTHKNWKRVITQQTLKPKSKDLITDALFINFNDISENNKEFILKCVGGFEKQSIELFFVGDTDFFSIDINGVQNFWNSSKVTTFEKEALEEVTIRIRPKVIAKGKHTAFIAFVMNGKLSRIALQSNVLVDEHTVHENIDINLGLVEADSIGFTDYYFYNLEELPLDLVYKGDKESFNFMINGDSINLDSIKTVVPNSDTLILSVAPIAKVLGDKYALLELKNHYITQEINLTSRVFKVRGDVNWVDTLQLINNFQTPITKVYYPADTIWTSIKFVNNSDYDTLFDVASLISISNPKWLKTSIPLTNLSPRSEGLVQIPFVFNKKEKLDSNLKGEINILIQTDSSVYSQEVVYNPNERMIEELGESFPKELIFSSLKDTIELKIPYLNTSRNAVYPSVKSFIKEINKPSDIKIYYGSPRIKSWNKGYVSIFLTPYDSINFHKSKKDTLLLEIYDQKIIAGVELVQEPLSAILYDYLNEIIIGFIIVLVIILGVLSPKIYKILKGKYAIFLSDRDEKNKEQALLIVQKMIMESNNSDQQVLDKLEQLRKSIIK